jgi:uncharacterized protein YacL (UPF0231 family)
LRFQSIDATHWSNRSAGVSKFNVSRGLELRQSDKIARAEVLADYVTMSTEKNAAIIAEPDIWLRGNAGEALTDAEQIVFEHQVRNETDRAWFAVEQYKLIGYKDFLEGDYAEFALFL